MPRAATAILRPRLRWSTATLARLSSSRPFSWTPSSRSAQPRSASRLPLPQEVAVLGGGLTGLTTAYYLAALLPPSCQITIYESESQTGGWIDSHRVKLGQGTGAEGAVQQHDDAALRRSIENEVRTSKGKGAKRNRTGRNARGKSERGVRIDEDEDDFYEEYDKDENIGDEGFEEIFALSHSANVAKTDVLEGGARMVAPQKRTARFDDLLFLELVDDLDLLDELRVSEAALAQYIYYPDRLVNVRLTADKPALRDFTEGGGWGRNGGIVGYLGYCNAMITWVSRCLSDIFLQPVYKGLFKWPLYSMLPSRAKAYYTHVHTLATMRAPGRIPPDTTVGAYFLRRYGSREPIDNMLSALMHGIYGGDVWRLSIASSPFRGLWLSEGSGNAFWLYARQARIEELRAAQRARGGPGAVAQFGATKSDRDQQDERELEEWEQEQEYYGQQDQDGQHVPSRLPPLTPETQKLAERYTETKRPQVALESDLAMVRDLLARQLDVLDQQRDLPTAVGGNAAVRFARLAEASTRWTTMAFARESGGFAALTGALARRLAHAPNVHVRTNERVTAVGFDADTKRVKISSAPASGGGEQHAYYDRVISTLGSPTLFRLTGGADGLLPSLQQEHAVTIQVVNLYYENLPGVHWPYKGFGYLIPQSVPLEQNPEAALGVIFDSDREMELRPLLQEERDGNDAPAQFEHWERTREQQDARRAARLAREASKKEKALADRAGVEQALGGDVPAHWRRRLDDTPRGSKFTVMFGGHYWDGFAPEDYPTADEAVKNAETLLRRHLASTDAATGEHSLLGSSADSDSDSEALRPTATRTKLCRECIPQHDVGHAERMAAVDKDLRRAFGGGRLAVAGGSFTATGPGVLSSIRSAWDIALRVSGRGYLHDGSAYLGGDLFAGDGSTGMTTMAHVGDTGLGRFADPGTDAALPVDRRDLPFRFGNVTSLHRNGAWTVQAGGKERVVMGSEEG